MEKNPIAYVKDKPASVVIDLEGNIEFNNWHIDMKGKDLGPDLGIFIAKAVCSAIMDATSNQDHMTLSDTYFRPMGSDKYSKLTVDKLNSNSGDA